MIHDDSETLSGLLEVLREWYEKNAGVTRIELRPYNKHTDELLEDEAELPRFPLECLVPELEEALEALVALRVFDRRVVMPVVESLSSATWTTAPPRSPWWARRLAWLRDMIGISRG